MTAFRRSKILSPFRLHHHRMSAGAGSGSAPLRESVGSTEATSAQSASVALDRSKLISHDFILSFSAIGLGNHARSTRFSGRVGQEAFGQRVRGRPLARQMI
jgi:hypothetical protein